jgi:hypothetical protein
MSGFSIDRNREGVRVDPDTGTIEVVEFFGDGPGRIFGTRHLPAVPVIGGLVICSSIHAELLSSYRMEVALARAVAPRGIAVQRFHYMGHGHSDGRTEDVLYEGMVRDALAAAERLQHDGIEVTSFLGTRWGALPAASAVSRFDEAALALWEPVLSGEQFFREAFRARSISDLRDGGGFGASHIDTDEEMRSRGFVEVTGFPIHSALYETSTARTLAEELGDTPRPLFIGQIGRGKEPRASYRNAMDGWRNAGLEVHLQIHRQEEISWFLPSARRKQDTNQPLIEATADWLVKTSRRTAPSSA